MNFCAQIAEWIWSVILRMIKKNHRSFRMFQKQAKKRKKNSLIKPFSLWNSLCSAACKGSAPFSLDENSLVKRGFRILSSEIHIFGYTDPFFTRSFTIILSSPTESEKNTSMTLSSNREYRLWSLPIWFILELREFFQMRTLWRLFESHKECLLNREYLFGVCKIY